jgi:hypothetical protein
MDRRGGARLMAGHDTTAQAYSGVAAASPQPQPAEDTAHQLQAMSEGVVLSDRVECMGGHYRIADKVGLMPLMKFSYMSKRVDESDIEAMAAIYEMLKDCIHADDWPRFVNDMIEKKAEADDMLPVVSQTFELMTARPTRRPTDSSSGPPTITPTSTGDSLPAGPRVPDWARETVPVTHLGLASGA